MSTGATAPNMIGVILLLEAAVLAAAGSHHLPPTFKRCVADEPKPVLNECLRNAVEGAFQSMKDGIPSLGVLPIDPFNVNEIDIDQQGTGSVRINMHLQNISMVGLAETHITNYSADLGKRTLFAVSLTPSLLMEFMHNVSGRVLLLPISGVGPGTINVDNIIVDHYLSFSPLKKKDGQNYWKMEDYKVRLKPKSVRLDFRGLFPGDPRLGEQMRTFIMQNSNIIFEEMSGAFEEAFGALFKEVTNRIFTKVPTDDIFIPSKDSKING